LCFFLLVVCCLASHSTFKPLFWKPKKKHRIPTTLD
jgi:hypothetical protein